MSNRLCCATGFGTDHLNGCANAWKPAEAPTLAAAIPSDPVNPQHYAQFKITPIQAIEEWGLGFSLGNTVKYIARAKHKNPDKEVEDLKKACWYLQREIDRLEAGGRTTP